MQPPSVFTACFLKCCPPPGWKIVRLSPAVPGLIAEANFPDVLFTLFLLLFPLIKTYWYEDCCRGGGGEILHPDSGSITSSYIGALPETAAEGNRASVHCLPSPR